MLEKYLPFLRPREKQERNLDPLSPVSDESLFFDSSLLKENVTVAGVAIKFCSSLIIIFSLCLIVLLGVHSVANFLLRDLLNEQKNLEYKINGYSGTETGAAKIVEKINYYKMTVAERKPLTTRISFIMSRIPSTLQLKVVDFKQQNFEISVIGERPVFITEMFLSWLRDGGVSEVSIKDAVYNSSENNYMVRLGGVYR